MKVKKSFDKDQVQRLVVDDRRLTLVCVVGQDTVVDDHKPVEQSATELDITLVADIGRSPSKGCSTEKWEANGLIQPL